MSTKKNGFYVTTPIYYVTAKPHLGHLYSTVIADVLARWHKLQNVPSMFLTGTDEFGQKIAQAASKAGKEPKEFVDGFIDAYKNVWKDYGIEYDIFMRTTNDFHIKAVQEWLTRLIAKGDVYKSFYEGWYCIPDETFITELEVSKEAPNCPSCGRQTQWLSEEAYFFKLSAYQDKLLKFYEENPDFIVPKERAQEVINFVKAGLRDLSISRTTISWGVPFPNDNKHVTYVWADALNNYITAIGWAQKDKEKIFGTWWPADVHVMGKDIVRFHAIYWPAFLMASDLQLPKHLLVHGWFKVGQQKMSKSFGNVIDPVGLYNDYGADQVRYYLMRQMAVTHDGEFSVDDLEQKISSDLADDLGNLLNRMVTLAQKYNISSIVSGATWSKESKDLYQDLLVMNNEYQIHMNEFMFHMALNKLWRFINQINAYFHAQEPWKLAAKDPEKFREILSATAHSLQAVALMLWPVMPAKMELLLESLGVVRNSDINSLDIVKQEWKQTFTLKKINNLFEKPMTEKTNSLNVTQSEPVRPTLTDVSGEALAKTDDSIAIEDFAKVHLIVGTIEQCETIEQSDKLYKLRVNLGVLGIRQILSGIRKYFKPEELVGKQGVFVANLKPRKMMGIESQGMMLLADDGKGTLRMIMPESPVPNGTRLK